MAYTLYDDNGYLADGPTVQGLEDLHEWANDKPAVKQFLMDGETADAQTMAASLEAAGPAEGTVEESRLAMLDAAKNATGRFGLSGD